MMKFGQKNVDRNSFAHKSVGGGEIGHKGHAHTTRNAQRGIGSERADNTPPNASYRIRDDSFGFKLKSDERSRDKMYHASDLERHRHEKKADHTQNFR